jgi:hypothetical protein
MNVKINAPTLRAAISEHPWSSLALAFVVGGWLADIEPRGRMSRAAASVLGTLALAALREAATRQVLVHAKSWIDQRVRLGDVGASAL